MRAGRCRCTLNRNNARRLIGILLKRLWHRHRLCRSRGRLRRNQRCIIPSGLNPITGQDFPITSGVIGRTVRALELGTQGYRVQGRIETAYLHPVGAFVHQVAIGPGRHIRFQTCRFAFYGFTLDWLALNGFAFDRLTFHRLAFTFYYRSI
ncbi:MAG: hypothetical protein BWX80_02459 [Candidatus Hydrogenedentes bacterium ADurb.Bin101]|nr:MAG: hypothetical protein BWX80_02459 [Candidatus Hydrogenedentes bacterium ADurb.Bin101]